MCLRRLAFALIPAVVCISLTWLAYATSPMTTLTLEHAHVEAHHAVELLVGLDDVVLALIARQGAVVVHRVEFREELLALLLVDLSRARVQRAVGLTGQAERCACHRAPLSVVFALNHAPHISTRFMGTIVRKHDTTQISGGGDLLAPRVNGTQVRTL